MAVTERPPTEAPPRNLPPEGAPVSASASRALAVAYPLGGVAATVLAWWLAVELLVEPGSFLAQFAPREAFAALWELTSDGTLWPHLVASLKRILVGLALAVVLGVPLGLAIGSSKRFASAATPVAGFIRMISPLSWTPLAIIWFGVGDAPVYFLVAVGAIWPVTLSTAAGVAGLDRRWLLLARSLRASRVETIRTVVLPGIQSDVLTGIRLATGTAWIILVPAEMLGVDSGLGYYILNARDRFAYGELVATILVIGAIGLALDQLTSRLLTPRRRRRAPQPQATEAAPVPATGYRI